MFCEWLTLFIASPVLILSLIIAKVFFNKKLSNKVFWITFFILFILLLILSYIVSKFSYANIFLDVRNQIQIISQMIVLILLTDCLFFIKCFMVLFPLIFLCSLFYFIRTRNKEVFKKLFISLLILAPFVYVSYPLSQISLRALFIRGDVPDFNTIKYISDHSVLPPVRAFFADMFTIDIQDKISEKYYNYNNRCYEINSKEAQDLLDEYIKYQIRSSDVFGYDFYFAYFMNQTGRYEEAIKIVEKIKKQSGKLFPQIVTVYIQQKNYKKALEIIDNIEYKENSNRKFSDYIKIYVGLGDFDNAYKYLDKFKDVLEKDNFENNKDYLLYKRLRIYLAYKSGNIKLAEVYFNELKKNNDFSSSSSFSNLENYSLPVYVEQIGMF